jgi:hypothetical protein
LAVSAVSRLEGVNGEAGRALTWLHLHCAERAARGFDTLGAVSLSSQTAGSLQGVPPSCCGRRVAVWSRACSNRPSGFGEAARRASSLRTWRWRVRRSPWPSSPTTHPPYVPRPSAVDHLDRDMLNPTSDLLSHCHRRVRGVRCALADRRGLRGGWVTAVNGATQSSWVSAAPLEGERGECHGQAAV